MERGEGRHQPANTTLCAQNRILAVSVSWNRGGLEGVHDLVLPVMAESQEVTPLDRYRDLIESLQETARRIITFGLHVHVAVDSGDKAIMICDRILQHLPTLLALSANSPFWQGRNTGLHSQRSKIMEDRKSVV